jgi:hypothetical protein
MKEVSYLGCLATLPTIRKQFRDKLYCLLPGPDGNLIYSEIEHRFNHSWEALFLVSQFFQGVAISPWPANMLLMLAPSCGSIEV